MSDREKLARYERALHRLSEGKVPATKDERLLPVDQIEQDVATFAGYVLDGGDPEVGDGYVSALPSRES